MVRGTIGPTCRATLRLVLVAVLLCAILDTLLCTTFMPKRFSVKKDVLSCGSYVPHLNLIAFSSDECLVFKDE